MIFTATETSTRFYITKGWSANSETPLQEITLDYLTIVEIPNQINYISCTSLNNNLTMLSNSGVNINDSLSVKGYLNAYYNAQFSYLAYQQVISNCATYAGSYVLPRKGTQADFVESGYRFGFNGMERDDEAKGEGNSYDFGARIYDSRLGRWFSIDPLFGKYTSYSPYNFALNIPIVYKDIDGKDVWVSIAATNIEYSGHASITVSNYEKVLMTVDGKKVEMYRKVGYTTYDLTPKKKVDGLTVGGYKNYLGGDKKNPNPVFTESENAIFKVNETTGQQFGKNEYFTKAQIQVDLNVEAKLKEVAAQDKDYNVVSNNCADYVNKALEVIDPKYKDISNETLKHPKFGFKAEVSTPNELGRGLKKAGVDTIKYEGDKINYNTQNYVDNYKGEVEH